MRGTFHLEGAPHFWYRARLSGLFAIAIPNSRRRIRRKIDSGWAAARGQRRRYVVTRSEEGLHPLLTPGRRSGLGRPAATVRRVVVVCYWPTVRLRATRRRLVCAIDPGWHWASPGRQRALVFDRFAPGSASVGRLFVHLGGAATRGPGDGCVRDSAATSGLGCGLFSRCSRRGVTSGGRRAAGAGRARRPGGTLIEQEVPETADDQHYDGCCQHDRKAVDQRVRDVDRDVAQCGAVVLADERVPDRHRSEEQQRRLGHRGEESLVRSGNHSEETAQEVERREHRGELSAASGGIDQYADGGDTGSKQDHSPPGQAGDGHDERSLVQRYPGASTLGCRHITTLAVLALSAVFVRVVAGAFIDAMARWFRVLRQTNRTDCVQGHRTLVGWGTPPEPSAWEIGGVGGLLYRRIHEDSAHL